MLNFTDHVITSHLALAAEATKSKGTLLVRFPILNLCETLQLFP